jgi:hypothetical protein
VTAIGLTPLCSADGILVAVETNKEVGDVDHLKVFATAQNLPMNGSRRTIRRALLLNKRF